MTSFRFASAAPAAATNSPGIFYATVDRTLAAVPVEENSHDIHLGAPQSLFRLPGDTYDVGPDGHKFLVDLVGDQSTKPITLLQNWTSVLKH